jgi:hypothetical protein
MELLELSFDEFDALTNTYSDNKISQQFGVGKSKVGYYRRKLGVKSYAEKNGITVGVKGVSNSSNRKIWFDERFFQNIDSEIKAYALGFLMTDGHITKEMHRASMYITEADSYLLKEMADAMGFTGNLLVAKPAEGGYQVHDVYILNLNSTVLCQDLVNLGLSSPKSSIHKLPSIPSELECHLLRGMWDADGSISKNDTSSTLSGNQNLLESVAKCLDRNGINHGAVRKDKTIWRITCHGIKALDWIYGCNPSIVLERKLERYKIRKLLSLS